MNPYTVDRKEDTTYVPLFQPQKNDDKLKWRTVNRDPYYHKNYGPFKLEKQLTYQDIKKQAAVDAARAESERQAELGGARNENDIDPASKNILLVRLTSREVISLVDEVEDVLEN